jgi:hypothetical protein
MMTTKRSHLARLSGGLTMAALALTFSFSSPAAVRAEDPQDQTPTLQELVIDPIMKAMEGLDQRIWDLEEKVSAWADSITTKRMIVQEICLADESGAHTCINKERLDALLLNAAHAQAEVPQPPVALTEVAPPAEEIVVIAPTENSAPQPEPVAVPPVVQVEPEVEQTGSIEPAKEQAEPEVEQTGNVVPAKEQVEPEVEQTGSIAPESPESPNAASIWVPEVETTIAVEAPEQV